MPITENDQSHALVHLHIKLKPALAMLLCATLRKIQLESILSAPAPSKECPMSDLAYRRILLKLSGEALMGSEDYGIDPKVIHRLAAEVVEAQQAGVEIAVVIGGGNIFRGAGLAAGGMDRVTGDHMGMLATVINALAMQDAVEKLGAKARVMSAIKINDVCEDFIRRRAIRHLEKGRIVIFAAGTGSPFFTTDSGAALRAIEISADLLLKATKVDGVYDKDPKKYPDATRFESLTYEETIRRNLQVMDTTAFALARDSYLPLRIFDMDEPGTLLKIIKGAPIGTLVHN
jgi:uridylate kinase